MLAPRVYFAMAQDGVFPAAAAAASTRASARPRARSRSQAVLASRPRRHSARSTRSSPTSSSSPWSSSRHGGVRLRARAAATPAFRVPGYPWTRADISRSWSAACSVLLALNNPLQAALGVGLVAAGIPVYPPDPAMPAASAAVAPGDGRHDLDSRRSRSTTTRRLREARAAQQRSTRSSTRSRHIRTTTTPMASSARTR